MTFTVPSMNLIIGICYILFAIYVTDIPLLDECMQDIACMPEA